MAMSWDRLPLASCFSQPLALSRPRLALSTSQSCIQRCQHACRRGQLTQHFETSAGLRVAAAGAACAVVLRRFRGRRCSRTRLAAVRLAELLPPELAEEWEELAIPDGLCAVAADLGDLERCLELVVSVFGVTAEEKDGVQRGLTSRLGASRSLIGADASCPRPRLARPAAAGSTKLTELGLVLALETEPVGSGPLAALVDLSLWPDDGRVRAPGASSKPGVSSLPYVLNLCVDPAYRRRGLARALMALSERLLRDVWGDSDVTLHVENDKVAANTLYEAIGYVAQRYTYDPECPYTKAEAAVLKTVTWRRKMLSPPTAGSPAATGALLPEQQAEEPDTSEETVVQEEDEDEDEDEEEESEEEEDEEDDEEVDVSSAEEEDFSWVSSLKK